MLDRSGTIISLVGNRSRVDANDRRMGCYRGNQNRTTICSLFVLHIFRLVSRNPLPDSFYSLFPTIRIFIEAAMIYSSSYTYLFLLVNGKNKTANRIK